ncbi:MAG: hypothetical protein WKF34_09950 [Pyrinomonadaceae bacterium]
MKRIASFTFITLFIALVASAGVSAQTSVAGEWDAAMNTPGGARPFKIIFKVDGEKLTGTVKRASGDASLTGTVKGNDIAFAYTINYNSNDLTLSFTGKLSGDNLAGTVSFGGNAEDTWSAKRTATEKPK